MRLVERCGVDDTIDPAQASAHEVTIHNRADVGGKGGLEQIESYDVMSALPQSLHKTCSEVPRAASDEYAHSARSKNTRAFVAASNYLPCLKDDLRREKGHAPGEPD